MIFQILIVLIPLIRNKSILYVKEIYLLNNNYHKGNFSIILSLRGMNKVNIPEKLIINNIFNIIIESQSTKEQNKIIAFECGLFNLNSYSEIKCILKEITFSNFIEPFYLRTENSKKVLQFNLMDNLWILH